MNGVGVDPPDSLGSGAVFLGPAFLRLDQVIG
jgi:hypothetical protein